MDDDAEVQMNVRFLAVPVVAFLAGLGGGWVSHLLTLEKISPPTEKTSDLRFNGTVRATRFELVDEAGITKALLGVDADRDTALVFLDGQKRERAKFGVSSMSHSPTMVMRGRDGNERVIFRITTVDDRPVIFLKDHERTRVELGFSEPDDGGPEDDDWGIAFYRGEGLRKTLAALGMRHIVGETWGFVSVSGNNGQMWSEPRR